MKIIHCADLHLDSAMTAHLPSTQAKERKAELLNNFIRLVEYAEKNNVSVIIIAGDLFDKKILSATAKRVVSETIRGHSNILFYYLQGNHDSSALLDSMEEVPLNLKMFDHTWTQYMLGTFKGRNIVLTGVELDSTNSAHIGDSLQLKAEDYNVVTMHGQQMNYGAKDRAEVINLADLRQKSIDYLALGHVHEYQHGKLDSRGVWCYPGCLEGRGFDEYGKHGFVLLTFDDDMDEPMLEFIPFAKRCIHCIEIDCSGLMSTSEIINRIKEKLSNREYSKDLAKLVLIGNVDVNCEKNTTVIKEHFQDDFYFLCVADDTKFAIDYNDYALDKSLKGELVRNVQANDSLTEEEKASIIRCGIQALNGEDFEL